MVRHYGLILRHYGPGATLWVDFATLWVNVRHYGSLRHYEAVQQQASYRQFNTVPMMYATNKKVLTRHFIM